jgi:DNA topoisomerase-1
MASVPAITEPELAAERAGLRYVADGEPGISRRRCGRGFSYLDPAGGPVRSASVRERIGRLAIPPAWTDVWICTDEAGHLQATGRDDRGRKQYRYHDGWRAARDADKFEQLASFGLALPTIRRQVSIDLDRRGLPRERVIALVVRLLDETLVRVGNPQYALDESFGLTTLEGRHLGLERGSLIFEFTGKSGVEHEVTVTDPELVRAVRACDDLGGEQLFTYRKGDAVIDVRSDDVNDYLRAIAGPEVTARDFRTWGGTSVVVEALGPLGPITTEAAERTRLFLEAVDLAAERLGNTRAVCRSSYLHPELADAFDDGRLAGAWRRARRSRWLTRAERATLHLLGGPDHGR